MGFLALLGPLFSSLFGNGGAITQYFKAKSDQAIANAQLMAKIADNKLELSMEYAKDELEAEKAKLGATSSLTKAVIIWGINIPIIITCISPRWGSDIFNALQIVPKYYAMLDVAIVGTVFGLPIAANWMGTVFDEIKNVWADNHQRTLEVIQANGQAESLNLEQAKSQIFDIMKSTVHLNGYTQGQVDAINKVLDPILNQVGGQNGK